MSKMFVHYSGTVADFKKLSNISDYDSKIVFIKGGTEGKGAAIYTHGSYFANFSEFIATYFGELNYVKGINVGGQSYNAAAGGGYVAFNAKDNNSTVTVNVTNDGVVIGLHEDFINKVNNTAADLGAKGDDANAEGSAFARIAQLNADINSLTGGNGSVATQIANAIAALDVDAVSGDYVASVKQVDGKIEATMGTFNFDVAGTAANVKSEVIGSSDDASTSDTIYGAKKYADAQIAALDADVTSAAKTGTVEGDVDHKVRVQVVETDGVITAVNVMESDIASAAELAAVKEDVDAFFKDALGDSDALQVKDTLREILDYINSDATAASEMTASIKEAKDAANAADAKAQTAQNEVDALEGIVAGVKATADATAEALTAEVNRAKAAEEANAASIKAVSDDYLKAADKTDLVNSISAVNTVATNAKTVIEAMDLAKIEGFVTSIEQVDGKVTATAVSTIAAEKITIVDTEDHFDANTTNVESALAVLANMWAWEEL